jgi:hypothetical protein
VPPDDAWRNLVADREREDCRMVREFGHAGDNVAPDASREAPVVEKAMLSHGRPTMTRRPFRAASSSRSRRRRIRADGVDAEGRHHPEVFGDALRTGELVAVCVGRKRSIVTPLTRKRSFPARRNFPSVAIRVSGSGVARERTAELT